MFRKAHLFAYALCGAFCLPAQADVVFSNLTGTFSTGNEAPVCITPDLGCPFGTVAGGYIYQAVAFTPHANFTLSTVHVAVRGAECAGAPPTCIHNSYNLALYSDSNGLPGAVIASSSVALAPAAPAVQTLNMGPVTLSAGTRYWLAMLPRSGGTFTYWMGGGSASVPAAFISYNAFTGQNGGSGDIHQPPKWLFGGTSTLQFEIDGVPVSEHGSFETFSVPGANNTLPYSINERGAVAGLFLVGKYFDAHGFLREPDGTITTFDPPDGQFLTPSAPLNSPGMTPLSINAAGAIAGYYIPNNTTKHLVLGFIREPDGAFTSFSLPGAYRILNVSINAGGAITGTYNKYQGLARAFIRHPNGQITLFDFPGSEYTVAVSINAKGAVTGYYSVPNGDQPPTQLAFVREPGGSFSSFSEFVIQPVSINYEGTITGSYLASGTYMGFVRDSQGKLTSFNVNSAGTQPTSMNDGGVITGGAGGHGFVRTPDGTITLFDVPACVANTTPQSINYSGAITGWCTDPAVAVNVGFLRLP